MLVERSAELPVPNWPGLTSSRSIRPSVIDKSLPTPLRIWSAKSRALTTFSQTTPFRGQRADVLVIADTSVLLNLCRVAHEHLLPALFHEVQIPPAVHAEFNR